MWNGGRVERAATRAPWSMGRRKSVREGASRMRAGATARRDPIRCVSVRVVRETRDLRDGCVQFLTQACEETDEFL